MSHLSDSFIINDHIQVFPGRNGIVFLEKSHKELILEPRIIRLLVHLCNKAGETCSRDELLRQIWGDKLVGEEGLTKAISILRATLKDPYLIKTIPKQGYAFVGEISTPPPAQKPNIKQFDKVPVAITVGTILFLAAIFSLVSFYDFNPAPEAKPDYQYAYLTDVKGLHLSPAISSDGRLVAYAERSKGEARFQLIVKSAATGEILSTTSNHLGDYLNPVFSPDNALLAFVNKEAGYTYLSIIPTTGGNVKNIYRTHNQADPSIDWSPDGRSLVFNDKTSSERGHDLYVYSLDNAEVRKLLIHDLDEVNPVFSPDGKQLAFIQRSGRKTSDKIAIYDFETGNHQVLRNIKNDLYDLDWSKNGKSILFTSADGFDSFIHKLAVATNEVSLLSNQSFYEFSVNSNEDQLVASTYTGDNNIWVKSLSEPVKAAQPILNSNRYEFQAEISPDQSKIAYISDFSGSFQVWEYDMVTKKSKQRTKLKGNNQFDKISWSPDGQQLLVGVKSPVGSGVLYMTKGQEPEFLLQDKFIDQFPGFSGSNQGFHFISNRSNRNELWFYDLTNHQINKVSHIQEEMAYAQVDHKGEYIYFTQIGKEGLWKSSWDGTEKKKVFCQVTVRDFKSWSLFPDGVYFIDRNPENHSISFFDFNTGIAEFISSMLPHNQTYNSSISISNDKSLIIYNQIDHFQSDIVLLQAETTGD